MNNNAFHRFCYEWERNMEYNDDFETFVNVFIKAGELPESVKYQVSARHLEMERQIVKDFKKLKKYPYLQDSTEIDMYIDLMPMGGYTDYTEINTALKNKRDREKAMRG